MKRTSETYPEIDRMHSLVKDIIHTIILLIIFVLISGISVSSAYAQTNLVSPVRIVAGDEWHYFKGVQKPPHNWQSTSFDDSSWLKGPTGIGYGNSSSRTNLADMQGNYSTLYFRKNFTINDIYVVTGMTLSVVCDGPFIAYLNDIEIIRNDSITKPVNDSSIITPPADLLDISGFVHELFPGNNVLAVECNNDDITSNDFSFIPFFEIHEYQGGDVK